MTIEEIRANAPDGATHYIAYEGTLSFHIKIGHFWYEITPKGNEYTHPSWLHLIKPLHP